MGCVSLRPDGDDEDNTGTLQSLSGKFHDKKQTKRNVPSFWAVCLSICLSNVCLYTTSQQGGPKIPSLMRQSAEYRVQEISASYLYSLWGLCDGSEGNDSLKESSLKVIDVTLSVTSPDALCAEEYAIIFIYTYKTEADSMERAV